MQRIVIAFGLVWMSACADGRYRDDLGQSETEASDISETVDPVLRDEDGDGYIVGAGDCDDSDAEVHPNADEGCNGLDNDCDGEPDSSEADADGDGFMLCEGDCDDSADARYPGAPELCDGLDNDCDLQADEGC